MPLMAFTRLKLLFLLTTAAECLDILSTPLVTVGGNFTATCNALRLKEKIAPDQSAFTEINYLRIWVNLTGTSDKFETVAQYITFGPPNRTEIKVIPEGKKWDIDFRGAGTTGKNRDTMELVLRAHEAQCSDAGLYKCEMDYFGLDSHARRVDLTEELKVNGCFLDGNSTQATQTSQTPQTSQAPPSDSSNSDENLLILIIIVVPLLLLICLIPCVILYRRMKSKTSKEEEVPQQPENEGEGKPEIFIEGPQDETAQPAEGSDRTASETSGVSN